MNQHIKPRERKEVGRPNRMVSRHDVKSNKWIPYQNRDMRPQHDTKQHHIICINRSESTQIVQLAYRTGPFLFFCIYRSDGERMVASLRVYT